MKYLPIHSSSSILLRYDNLWTNLNQFCVNIMELIVFITHNWLYGRFYISEFTCFSFFSPDLCCDTWARFVQILLRLGRLLRFGGVVANGWVNFQCTYRALFLLNHPPSIKYCTYTVIISSGLPEALNSE